MVTFTPRDRSLGPPAYTIWLVGPDTWVWDQDISSDELRQSIIVRGGMSLLQVAPSCFVGAGTVSLPPIPGLTFAETGAEMWNRAESKDTVRYRARPIAGSATVDVTETVDSRSRSIRATLGPSAVPALDGTFQVAPVSPSGVPSALASAASSPIAVISLSSRLVRSGVTDPVVPTEVMVPEACPAHAFTRETLAIRGVERPLAQPVTFDVAQRGRCFTAEGVRPLDSAIEMNGPADDILRLGMSVVPAAVTITGGERFLVGDNSTQVFAAILINKCQLPDGTECCTMG